MSKSHIQALAIFLVAALWIASGYIFPAKTEEKKEKFTEVSKELPKVRITRTTSNLRQKEISLIGKTKPFKVVEVKAEIAGKVEKIYAKEGEKVEKGEPILRIEKRSRQARVDELRALVEQKSIAYDAAVRLAATGLSSKVKVAQTKSELEAAKASLIQANIDLNNTILAAPFDGILEKIYVEEGDYVELGLGGGFGSVAIAKVIDNSPFIIEAGVSEKVAAGIKKGAKAKVTLVTGETLDGLVTYISKVANEQTRTFNIEVTVDSGELNISSGVTATVSIGMENLTSHKIPSSALAIDDAGRFGIKILENAENISEKEFKGTAKFYAVNIFDSDETGVWVNGLPEDIMLITVGQAFVKDNANVIGVLNETTKTEAQKSRPEITQPETVEAPKAEAENQDIKTQ